MTGPGHLVLLLLTVVASTLGVPQVEYAVAALPAGVPHGGCPEWGVFGYPHPKACDQYFRCENGTLTAEICPNGLLFDPHSPIYDFCGYPFRVDCGDRLERAPPISTPNCPWQWGLFPVSAGCETVYFECAWGLAKTTPCKEGLAYDEATHSCNWPDLLPGCSSEAITGFTCPDKIDGIAARFAPYPRYPHPTDCTKLITCVHHRPRLIHCEYGKAFSIASHTCEPAEHVPDCALALKKKKK